MRRPVETTCQKRTLVLPQQKAPDDAGAQSFKSGEISTSNDDRVADAVLPRLHSSIIASIFLYKDFQYSQTRTNDYDAFIFADFDSPGFNITTVPEVSTWAMLLIGFAGIGLVARDRLNRARDTKMTAGRLPTSRYPESAIACRIHRCRDMSLQRRCAFPVAHFTGTTISAWSWASNSAC
jgi:hypothetical protein